ncbi:unnamed protein product [Amoebophrya sp. A120]|nr:unnamed protein product [Amoebophrya sp. A120]|eukprot:GSA120T00004959001.1
MNASALFRLGLSELKTLDPAASLPVETRSEGRTKHEICLRKVEFASSAQIGGSHESGLAAIYEMAAPRPGQASSIGTCRERISFSRSWTVHYRTAGDVTPSLILQCPEKEDYCLWFSLVAGDGILSAECYVTPSAKADQEVTEDNIRHASAQLQEILTVYKEQCDSAAICFLGFDLNMKHETASREDFLDSIRLSSSSNFRGKIKKLLIDFCEQITVDHDPLTFEGPTYRNASSPDVVFMKGRELLDDLGHLVTYRWTADGEETELPEIMQDHAAIGICGTIETNIPEGKIAMSPILTESSRTNPASVFDNNACDFVPLQVLADSNASQHEGWIYGAFEDYKMIPRSIIPRGGFCGAMSLEFIAEREIYKGISHAIRIDRGQKIDKAKFARAINDARTDFHHFRSLSEFEDKIAETLLKASLVKKREFSSRLHLDKPVSSLNANPDEDGRAESKKKTMATAKQVYLGRARGEPIKSVKGIVCDGTVCDSPPTALINTARIHFAKPMTMIEFTGAKYDYSGTEYRNLLDLLLQHAKFCHPLEITTTEAADAIAEMSEELQGPTGIRGKVFSCLPGWTLQTLVDIISGELKAIRDETDAGKLHDVLDQVAARMIGTFLAKDSQKLDAEKLRITFKQLFSERMKEKILRQHFMALVYEKARHYGVTFGGMPGISLLSTEFRRRKLKSSISRDDFTLVISLDLKQMFNCLTRLTSRVVFKSVGARPVFLIHNLLRFSNKKIYLTSDQVTLRVSDYRLGVQGTHSAWCTGALLLAPWLAAAQAAINLCYDEHGKLDDKGIGVAKAMIRVAQEIIRSDFRAAMCYAQRDISQVYQREAVAVDEKPSFLSDFIQSMCDKFPHAKDRKTAMGCVDDTDLEIAFRKTDVGPRLPTVTAMIAEHFEIMAEVTKTFLAVRKCEAIVISHDDSQDAATECNELATAIQQCLRIFGKAIRIVKSAKLFGFPIACQVGISYRSACRQHLCFALAITREAFRLLGNKPTLEEFSQIPGWATTSRVRHLLVVLKYYDEPLFNEITNEVAVRLMQFYGVTSKNLSRFVRGFAEAEGEPISAGDIFFAGLMGIKNWKERYDRTIRRAATSELIALNETRYDFLLQAACWGLSGTEKEDRLRLLTSDKMKFALPHRISYDLLRANSTMRKEGVTIQLENEPDSDEPATDTRGDDVFYRGRNNTAYLKTSSGRRFAANIMLPDANLMKPSVAANAAYAKNVAELVLRHGDLLTGRTTWICSLPLAAVKKNPATAHEIYAAAADVAKKKQGSERPGPRFRISSTSPIWNQQEWATVPLVSSSVADFCYINPKEWDSIDPAANDTSENVFDLFEDAELLTEKEDDAPEAVGIAINQRKKGAASRFESLLAREGYLETDEAPQAGAPAPA